MIAGPARKCLILAIALGALAVAVPTAWGGAYRDAVIADTPIGYWRLGETSGTIAADASGGGRAGSYLGGVTLDVPGALFTDSDRAARFDGVDDAAQVSDDAALRLNGSWSIEFWAKENLFVNSWPGLLVKGGAYSANGYLVWYDAWGGLWFKRNNVEISAGTTISSQFQHFVITYDGANVRWYANGVLTSTTAVTYPTNAGTDPLQIGRGDQYGNSDIDEVAVYGTALSSARVAAHYDAALRTEYIVMVKMGFDAATVAAQLASLYGGTVVRTDQGVSGVAKGLFVIAENGALPTGIVNDSRVFSAGLNELVQTSALQPARRATTHAPRNVRNRINSAARPATHPAGWRRAIASPHPSDHGSFGPRFEPGTLTSSYGADPPRPDGTDTVCVDPPQPMWPSYGQAPSLSGSPQVGSSLTAFAGDWDTDGPCTTAYGFTWYRKNLSSGALTLVAQRTVSYPTKTDTYGVSDADSGYAIIVKVVAYEVCCSNFAWTNQTARVPYPTPETALTGTPPNPARTYTPSFSFTGTHNTTGFWCALDPPLYAYQGCWAPWGPTVTGGPHTFSVYACNADGCDSTPVSYSFTSYSPSCLNQAPQSYDFSQCLDTTIERVGGLSSRSVSGDNSGAVGGVVGIIDSGVAASAELNRRTGVECGSGANGNIDTTGHGTQVAGLLGARDNSFGVVGAAPGVSIQPLNASDDRGAISVADIASCLNVATQTHFDQDQTNDISVLNISLSVPLTDQGEINSLHEAVIAATNQAKITIVAAAGNAQEPDPAESITNKWYPAAFHEVLAVTDVVDKNGLASAKPSSCSLFSGATWDKDDTCANISNFATPGSDDDHVIAGIGSGYIYTLKRNGGYEASNKGGTSYAAPIVAGAAISCIYYQLCPSNDPAAVRSKLVNDAGSYGVAQPGYEFYGSPSVGIKRYGSLLTLFNY